MVKLLKPKIRIQTRIFRRWMKRVGIVVLFLGFLAGTFYLVFKSEILTIKNVNCEVIDKTSIADEKRWCEEAERLLLGKRTVWSNLTTTVVNLEYKFLPIGEVVLQKKYPQTIIVQIIERTPIARICPSGGLEFLVDKEGVVFSETTPETEDLKKIVLELEAPLAVGQVIGEDTILLILLEDPQIRSIKHTGQGGIEVQTEENLTILFSREKNLESQIRSLQMIVKKYRIEGKQLKSVDLRYDQPVIKY